MWWLTHIRWPIFRARQNFPAVNIWTSSSERDQIYIRLSLSPSHAQKISWCSVDQEGHAEATSTENKRRGKVYRHHMTKRLPRVRLGVLVEKPLRMLVEKSLLVLVDKSLKLQVCLGCYPAISYIVQGDDADAAQSTARACNDCNLERCAVRKKV